MKEVKNLEAKGVRITEVDYTELIEIHKSINDFMNFLDGEYENIKKMEADRS